MTYPIESMGYATVTSTRVNATTHSPALMK